MGPDLRPFLPVLFGLLLLPALTRGAQPNETLPGFKAENVLEVHGIDNVNLFSGDPGVVIPLGPEYTLGPSFTWQLKAYYSAKLWHMSGCNFDSTTFADLHGDPTIGVGWNLQLGYVAAKVYSTGVAYQWVYHSPDGGSHEVNLPASPPYSDITKDGTHLRITAIPNPQSPTSYTVEFPDGTVQTFGHPFNPPRPTAGTSPDLSELDVGEASSPRFGLTTIKDSFGTVLLTVNYSTSKAWEATSVVLNPTGKSINFTWVPYTVTTQNVTWEVLGSMTFPAIGSSNLTVQFGYQQGTFPRNSYDLSANQTACPPASPPTVAVPELQTITFSDSSFPSFNYQFAYFSLPSNDAIPIQKQGALQTITLPTGGTIAYDYSKTTPSGGQISSTCDPETSINTGCASPGTNVALPPSALSSDHTRFNKFLDKSIAVSSRIETDPISGKAATTNYDRAVFYPVKTVPPFDGDTSRIIRRTIVTGPGNDAPATPTQYATRHYFHVAYLNDSDIQSLDSGIELERRTYPAADVTVPPIRSTIFCYEGDTSPFTDQCGYRTSGGVIQVYFSMVPRPQQAQVTWFGAVPTGSDGRTCPTGSTPCISRVNSGYVVNAGQYGTTVTSSANLPNGGGPSHTTYTDWTPFTDSTHWLLSLYDEKNDVESGTTIYRGYEFDSGALGANGIIATSGFLRGVMTSHLPYDNNNNRRLLLECSYPDSAGNPTKEFSATYDWTVLPAPSGLAGTTSVPYSKLCSAAYSQYPAPTVGTNNDAFGHVYSWSHGLLNSGAWVNGGSSGNPTTFSWFDFKVVRDAGSGLITTSRDTATVPTTYSYDALGRITQIAPTGESPTFICYHSMTLTTAYRASSAIACTTIQTGPTISTQTWQQYVYDGLGRLTNEIRAIPGAGGSGFALATRAHSYDSAGHRAFDSEWKICTNLTGDCVAAPVATQSTQSTDFDPFGRAKTVVRADGSKTTIDYTDGSILSSDTKKAVTVYNINGACTGTCSGGIPTAQTSYFYDSYGRLTKVTEPSGDLTTYAYDANGKLTTVTQGTQTRSFTYDQFGFLRAEATPEKGTVNYNAIGSLANVAQRTENDSTVISSIYDAAGRVSCAGLGVIVMSGGTCANGWKVPTQYVQDFFDGAGFAGGLNPLGKVTRRVGSNPLTSPFPTDTDDFTYSGLGGRLSQLSTTVTGGALGSVSQTWAYNNLGLVIQHSHARPGGNSIAPLVESTTYKAGLPVAVYANGMPAVTSVDYAPSGALNHYTTGLFAGQTVTTTLLPDPKLMPRPTQISTAGASINFNTGSYTYDGVGNITVIGADSFGYDNRSRLISANLSGAGSQSYTYDRYGNRTSQLQSGCTIDTQKNRLNVSNCVAAYDGRGNMTQSPFETYTYDPLDRTKTSTVSGLTSKYVFDAASERVVKIDSGSNWTYTIRDEAGRVSTEFAGAAQSRDNIFLGHQVVGSYANASVGSNGPVWSFYSSDHLGTPRLVTDVSATQVEARRYWPFGEQVIAAQPFQHIRFAAMEQDTEAGPGNDRYNDHARHHAAGLGRFLSVDSHDGDAVDPQSWNRYSYSRNNPIKYLDPDGQTTQFYEKVAQAARFLASVARGIQETSNGDAATTNLAGSAADSLDLAARTLEVGTSTGEAIGSGGDAYDVGNAFAADLRTASDATLAMAGAAEGVRSVGKASALPGEATALKPGPFAGESIAARGPGRSFNVAERRRIDQIGSTTGCHSCGSKAAGTKSGHFIPDHQPASALAKGKPQRLYPHCATCSFPKQANEVRKQLRKPEAR